MPYSRETIPGPDMQKMETHHTERELLVRCLKGDVSAFESLVAANRDRAYQYALSILRNHHDALDLSQEAFARAYRSLDRFDLNKPFRPWFLRILRNLCLNALKERTHRPENPGPADGMEFIEVMPDSGTALPDGAVQRRELTEQLSAAMDQLPPEHRDVLFFRHFEELSYEEIASVLDVPVGTVMSRLFHGRRKLAACLKKSDFGE